MPWLGTGMSQPNRASGHICLVEDKVAVTKHNSSAQSKNLPCFHSWLHFNNLVRAGHYANKHFASTAVFLSQESVDTVLDKGAQFGGGQTLSTILVFLSPFAFTAQAAITCETVNTDN